MPLNSTSNDKYLNITVHQDHRRPRFYKVAKKSLYFFIYIIPSLLVITTFVLGIIIIYFQDIKHYQKHHESKMLIQLKQQQFKTKQYLQEVLHENNQLQKKLTQPIEKGLIATLGLFQPIPGQTDLSSQGKIEIDQLQIKRTPQKLTITFNIKNLTAGKEKISGYIIGLAKSDNAIYAYPSSTLLTSNIQLAFNRGESFSTHRFRPSKIYFNIPNNIAIKLYEIFIFSRTGDLITRKIYSPQ